MTTASPDFDTARDRLTGDFRLLAQHAEELLQATKSIAGENVQSAREHLVASLDNVRSHVGAAHDQFVDHARAAATASMNYVRERPYQTLAAVLALGLIAGFIGAAQRKRQ